jgi:hypothetical protein
VLTIVSYTYRDLSSTTLITDRMPRWLSFGAGAPASEPSPRKRVPSSVLDLLRKLAPLPYGTASIRQAVSQLGRFSDRERSHSDCTGRVSDRGAVVAMRLWTPYLLP